MSRSSWLEYHQREMTEAMGSSMQRQFEEAGGVGDVMELIKQGNTVKGLAEMTEAERALWRKFCVMPIVSYRLIGEELERLKREYKGIV